MCSASCTSWSSILHSIHPQPSARSTKKSGVWRTPPTPIRVTDVTLWHVFRKLHELVFHFAFDPPTAIGTEHKEIGRLEDTANSHPLYGRNAVACVPQAARAGLPFCIRSTHSHRHGAQRNRACGGHRQLTSAVRT